jgi:hypothetical protein
MLGRFVDGPADPRAAASAGLLRLYESYGATAPAGRGLIDAAVGGRL